MILMVTSMTFRGSWSGPIWKSPWCFDVRHTAALGAWDLCLACVHTREVLFMCIMYIYICIYIYIYKLYIYI
jgi:hypothetical protein